MQYKGVLIEWNDDRGFGFITAQGDTRKLFVHISAFDRSARPRQGDTIGFAIGTRSNGQPAAARATILGVPNSARTSGPQDEYFDRHAVRVWAACLIIVLVFAVMILDRASLWLAAAYAVMGWISFVCYWWDKDAARARGWRMRERSLHFTDLSFGIIGGLLAQQVFRHKTSKPAFVHATITVATLHVVGLAHALAGFPGWAHLMAWLMLYRDRQKCFT